MAEQANNATSASEPVARVMPALSATSDAPKVETAIAAEEKPVDAGKVEAKPEGEVSEQVDTGAETGEVEASPKEVKPKDELPAYAKREITKARNQKREADAAKLAAETRANTQEANLKRALEAIERLTGESARKTIAEDPRPKREVFDNPESYDAALIEWAGRSAARVASAEAESRAETAKAEEAKEVERKATEEANKKTTDVYAKRREAFAAEHPDFEDVAEADDLKVSIPMAHAIMQDEDGPAILYYLGQNPDEAERISGLSPMRQVTELGRIAIRLNAKPAVSTKPKPITPLRTGEAPASARKDPSEMSMEEYAAWRKSTSVNGAGASH